MINVSIQIDKFKRKDDTYRMRILLTSKGKQAKIALPYTFPAGYWDGTRITKAWNGKGKTEWNVIIQRHLTQVRDFLIEKNDFKYHYEPSEIRTLWMQQQVNSVDFLKYYQNEIERLKKLGKKGSVRAHEETLVKLKTYRATLNISDITPRFLEAFNDFMKDLKPNSRGKHFRQIRSILYRADKIDGIKITDAFDRFTIPKEITQKRHRSIEDLIKLLHLKVEPRQEYYRDFFINQFRLGGISFADLYFLNPGKYKYITFQRHKIDKEKFRPVITTIVPEESKDFLINRPPPKDYKHYKYSMSSMNKCLKVLCEKAEIAPLSTHMARHTWNQTAKELGYDQELRMEIMGQKVPGKEINQIYSGQFPQPVKDACVLHLASLIK